MRFVVVTAPTLKELATALNEMVLGTGRVISCSKTGRVYEALIDMYPTHVVTNDDLLFEIDNDEKSPNGVVMAA